MFLFSRSLFAPLPPGVLADPQIFPPHIPTRIAIKAHRLFSPHLFFFKRRTCHFALPPFFSSANFTLRGEHTHDSLQPAGPTAADRGQPPLHPYHSPPHPQPHALLRHCGLIVIVLLRPSVVFLTSLLYLLTPVT
jgi:hypothetical protein